MRFLRATLADTPPGWRDRRRYEGLMKDGQCHGKGVFQYADGDRCAPFRSQRVWSACRQRASTLSAADAHARARSYEGEYLEGQMNGLGVYRWSNGRRAQALARALAAPGIMSSSPRRVQRVAHNVRARPAMPAPASDGAQHLQGPVEGEQHARLRQEVVPWRRD
jgi:hypothetical protein